MCSVGSLAQLLKKRLRYVLRWWALSCPNTSWKSPDKGCVMSRSPTWSRCEKCLPEYYSVMWEVLDIGNTNLWVLVSIEIVVFGIFCGSIISFGQISSNGERFASSRCRLHLVLFTWGAPGQAPSAAAETNGPSRKKHWLWFWLVFRTSQTARVFSVPLY